MWVYPNPPVDVRVRIVAIDPGSSTLGTALLLVDPVERTITVGDAFTYNVGVRIDTQSLLFEMYGAKMERLNMIFRHMSEHLYQTQPHIFIAESPYVGRFAAAYKALVEVRDVLRQALFNYDRTVQYEDVDPLTAKKAVGALVKKGSKDNVRDSVLALPDLIWAPNVQKYLLDEHSIDAIAVGYYRAKAFLECGY